MPRRVPIAVLRELYAYCPLSGVVSHRRNAGKARAGEEAGTISDDGYRVIKVSHKGKRIQIAAHIVAWAIHYGRYPRRDVDHRDTVKTNNTITNLRDASRSKNLANRSKKGALPKGVTFDRGRKVRPYRAQFCHRATTKYLGHFDTPEEAHAVWLAKATKVYGEFVRL